MDHVTFTQFAEKQSKESLKTIEKQTQAINNCKKLIMRQISTGKELYRYLAFKIFQVKFPKESEEDLIFAAEIRSVDMPDDFLKGLSKAYDEGILTKIECMMLTQKEKGIVFIYEPGEEIVK